MTEERDERATLPPERVRQIAQARVAVVVNGNARRVSEELVQVLDQLVQSGDLFVSRSLDEGRDIARRIVEQGYHTVLTGGGDGTFVQTVTWIVHESKKQGHEPPRFGLLRLGTGNALAWVLGAQNSRRRGVFADLSRLRREGGSRPLRLLEVEGTLSPFAGLGGDAIALQHFHNVKSLFERTPVLKKVGTGSLAYAAAIFGRVLPEYVTKPKLRVRVINLGAPALVIGPDGRPAERTIPAGATIFEGATKLVAASSIPYWGFGARVFPFADEKEGMFSLRLVDYSPFEFVREFRGIFNGTYRSESVIDVLAERVRVESDDPIPFQIGGDPHGERTSVEIAISDTPIRVVDYYAPPEVVERLGVDPGRST